MMIRTVREAELEMQLAEAQREIVKLRWMGTEPMPLNEPTELVLNAPSPPRTLRLIASTSLLRYIDGVPGGQVVLRSRAVGNDGQIGFNTYLSEGDLLCVRDASEYFGWQLERAMRQVADWFAKNQAADK